MAFKFGAALGGFAQTLAERVSEEEKRVDLLTNKALDLHTQLKLERNKENETNLKNAEALINALGITGLDLETRAAIAQGGKFAVEHTLKQYDAATAKGIDFDTVYKVSSPTVGTEEFTASDWAAQIVKPLPEPEIATGVLGESKTIFGPDPQAVLTRKIRAVTPDVVQDAVSQTFKPAELEIDMSQLSDKADMYSSVEEALVGTTYLLQQEKAKETPDQATITRLQGDLVAYGMLDEDAENPVKLADRIDGLGVKIAELDAMPEADRPEDWQSKRDTAQSTLDSFIRISNQITSAQDLTTEKFSSHNALLVSLDTQIMNLPEGSDQRKKLEEQRKKVLDQMIADKKELAEAEGKKAEDYTVFSNESVNSIINNALKRSLQPQGIEIGLQGELLTKLKGNEGSYIVGSLAAIDEVETTYKDVTDSVLQNALQAQKDRVKNYLDGFKNKKYNEFLTNKQENKTTKGFFEEATAAAAAQNAQQGKYAIGDMVQTKDSSGNIVIIMWTGTKFI